LTLKFALLSFTTIILSEPAVAGANLSSFPEVTSDTGGGDGTAGLVMLLVTGALILLNGPNGINRSQAKTPAQTADDDDEIIMKF
jgi:hypothetical protein